MTTYYLRSTTGNDANSGADWANAWATINQFVTTDVGGDILYVSQAHAESGAGNQQLFFAGSPGNPSQVICVDDGAVPPTTLAVTATLTRTGASVGFSQTLGSVYVYGITFISGTSGNTVNNQQPQTDIQIYDNCKFRAGAGTTSGRIVNAGSSGGILEWRDCYVRANNAVQTIWGINGFWHWNGGGIEAGGTSPTDLITYTTAAAPASGGVKMLIENCDFSNGSSTMNLSTGSMNFGSISITFRNCKLPSGWSGNFCSTFASNDMGRCEIYNCHDATASVNYKMKIIDGCGSIDHETTLVKSGGATDGTTQLAWKMTTNTQVAYPCAALFSPEIVMWCGVTGSPITLTVDVLHDSATNLTDAEAWLEVNYPASSSTPVDTWINDKVDVLTTASDQTSSSATWVTTGMSNPNKQKLSVTFTPQAIGWLKIRIALAKTSKTIYVDPLPTGLGNTMPAEISLMSGNASNGEWLGGQYFVRTQPFQFQAPGGAYVISGTLTGSLAQVAARYFQAC